MQAERGKVEDVLPSDFRGHPHTSITLMRPYALRMQAYAPITHFLPASRNRPGSRAERASKKPYALYAPLLGVGPFSVFFLLREVHTAAYGSLWNRALVLLPIGIGASSARRNQKCIRILADSRRNRPPMKSIRFRPSLIPLDAQAVFCSCMPFFGPPLTGFRAWDEVVGTGAAPWRRSRRGFAFQAVTSTEIEKRLGDVIVFFGRFHTADGNAARRSAGHSSAAGNQRPPIRPFGNKDGQWIPMEESSPSSQFLHFYASVCTSYAAVCSPYALFACEQEARLE